MGDVWTQNGATQLTVQARLGSIRFFFGLPLLLGGLYFLYKYALIGTVSIVQTSGWAKLVPDIPGLLITIILGLLFLVPGVLLICLRRTIVINTLMSELVEISDLLTYQRCKSYRLDHFNRVVVLSKSVKGTTLYHVELVTADEDVVHVATMDDEEPAETLSQTLATMLGLQRLSMDEQAWRAR
jgi:hypothetical protein